MEMRTIGGLQVSAVGLGCNNFGARADEEKSKAVIAAALDAGITLFDTADSYGMTKSEEILGKYLKGHRDDVVIATKTMKITPSARTGTPLAAATSSSSEANNSGRYSTAMAAKTSAAEKTHDAKDDEAEGDELAHARGDAG